MMNSGLVSQIFLIICTVSLVKLDKLGKKTEVLLNDDETHNWTSSGYPNPYLPQNEILIIKCEPGYSVLITIEKLDLDSESGDFLVIKPGISLEDNNKGKIYAYELKKEETKLVNSNSVLVSLQVLGKNENEKIGFSLSYKRVADATTITEPEQEVTTSAPGNDSYIIVYVAGKTEEEFTTTKLQMDFKIAVSKMALDYCKMNDIPLAEEITNENVEVRYLVQCPYTWPNRETCMKIQLAVPIQLVQKSMWNGYQLSPFHLDRMWYTLANGYLEEYGLTIYTPPTSTSILMWWIIILCGTIITFSLLLFLIKAFGSNIPKYDFKKKNNGTNTIPSTINGNPLTLNPYLYSRSIPPLFEYDDYSYKQCKSNFKMTGEPSPARIDPNLSDSDDDIILSLDNKNVKNMPKDPTPKESNI